MALFGGAVTWPPAARAQKAPLVGVLMNGNSNEPLLQENTKALIGGLRDYGWIEGRNLQIESVGMAAMPSERANSPPSLLR
jgi:hypothetical protein